MAMVLVSAKQLTFILYLSLTISLAFWWLRQVQRSKNRPLVPKGYKKLGVQRQSHVQDEYDDQYAIGSVKANGGPSSKWRVKALFIHPVKSCGEVELDAADVDAAGFTWDRKFAFAELLTPQTRLDAPDAEKKPRWTFRTQRQPGYEKLVHVKPEIWLPDDHAGTNAGVLLVKYPYVPSGLLAPLERFMIVLGIISSKRSFSVPLVPTDNHRYPVEEVTIWKDSPRWLNYGEHVPDDFATFLRVSNPLTLFRVDPTCYREVYRCAPRREQLGYQPVVGFADAYPVHMLNIASVRDLAARVKQDIPRFSARRFRSNILVVGPGAYNEDDWKRVRIGDHEFYCACHTVRCRLPNVDPDTAERHPVEPDKTLKSFRCIDDGDPLNACLGLQLVPAESERFLIQVGDEIEVLERGEHHYIRQ